MKLSSLLITGIFCIHATVCFAQEHASLNGYVTDAQTGETLIAANIALVETGRGSSSNTSGYYSITNIPPGTYTLVVSYIGYEQYREVVSLESGENRRMDIRLDPDVFLGEELVVVSEAEREERRNIGRAEISTELIKRTPSVLEPDVFRSIQFLPGVKAASDFSSGLYIRGGSPDQTLILLDETTVYNPTHFFGLFSTFNPDAVKNVQLYKGGYPAEYGGRIGSALTVYNKDGNRIETSGTVSLGMLASRASIEGPYKHGSYMLAVRRSTLEPILTLMESMGEDGIPDTFYFYDVNGKVNLDASQNDRISLAFYTGSDVVSFPLQQESSMDLNYGNQTVSGQWRRIFSNRMFGSFTLTGSRYFNEPEIKTAGTPSERTNTIHDFSLKGDLQYDLGEYHSLSAGIWPGIMTLNLDISFDEQEIFSNRIQSQYLSAYVQERWEPSDKWTVTGGLRLNTFSEGDYLRLAPRLSLEHQPTEKIRLQAAYGRYYQFLTLITNEAFTGLDIWLTADDGVPPAYGDQFVLGAKTVPFQGFGLDLELYYRTMNDLFELDPFVSDEAGLEYEELFRFGKGYAYGAELSLEKRTGQVTGFAGYTFGVTRRKFPGYNTAILNPSGQAEFYPPKYDRTHDINLVLSYFFSERWSVSSTFNYSTGQAYTEPAGRTQFPRVPWGSGERDAFVVEGVNGSRLPAYHRLDISFIRKGTFFDLGEAEWKFQVVNAYSHRNTWYYNYDFDENPVKRDEVTMLPIIPAISYTVNF